MFNRAKLIQAVKTMLDESDKLIAPLSTSRPFTELLVLITQPSMTFINDAEFAATVRATIRTFRHDFQHPSLKKLAEFYHPDYLAALVPFEDAGLLTTKNHYIASHCDYFDGIELLHKLAAAKLMTQEIYDVAFNPILSIGARKTIIKVYIYLNETGCLNQDKISLLQKNPTLAYNAIEFISVLETMQLLTPTLRKITCEQIAHVQSILRLYKNIIETASENELDQQQFNTENLILAVCENIKYKDSIDSCLQKMRHPKLFTEETVITVCNLATRSNGRIHEFIQILGDASLLSADMINHALALFLRHIDSSLAALYSLFTAKKLTVSTFLKIAYNPAEALFAAQQAGGKFSRNDNSPYAPVLMHFVNMRSLNLAIASTTLPTSPLSIFHTLPRELILKITEDCGKPSAIEQDTMQHVLASTALGITFKQ